jgi:two-component system sensor histidine kinase KdpD
LRIYLGYAPGVGKTYALLRDGQRFRQRGTDVVIGWVEGRERRQTLDAIGSLEIVPARITDHHGVAVAEMDLGAILRRRPRKRYQDVDELRASGINVITTLNIQHLVSLQQTVRLLTGVDVSETLPDWVFESADEVDLVD